MKVKATALFKPSRLAVVMGLRRMTRTELCELTGISKSKLARIMRAELEPDAETVRKIAKATNWSEPGFFYLHEIDQPDWVSPSLYNQTR
jgi:transcriptional regulator with XRE-family HTH domain